MIRDILEDRYWELIDPSQEGLYQAIQWLMDKLSDEQLEELVGEIEGEPDEGPEEPDYDEITGTMFDDSDPPTMVGAEEWE
jgi:hypothetical protein